MYGGTVISEDKYWRDDAIAGSLNLRNAILGAFGYEVPRKAPARTKKQLVAPRPIGRPPGSPNVLKPYMGKIEQIKGIVSQHCGISINDIIGPRRGYTYSHPRQVAMYAARQSGASYPMIGRLFGNRDHSTVVHAIRVVEQRLEKKDPDTISALHAVKARMDG